jgi:hypothetical protein
MRILILLLFVVSIHADRRNVELFAQSMEKEFGFNMNRFMDVSSKIKFGTESLLKQWGVINNYAEASYNDALNILEVKKELNKKVSFMKGRILTVSELKAAFKFAYTVKIDTIFHEMAHAEMDVFIEEKETPEDKKLYNILKNEVKPWFKKHFKASSKICFWEVHGYFVGQVIETLYSDMGDIAMYNGINQFQNKGFPAKFVKDNAATMDLNEFQKFHPPVSHRNFGVDYRDRIKVPTVWVRGKTIDISSIKDDPFKDEWYQALWDHFAFHFDPPKNISELTEQMNKYHSCLEVLKQYRKQYWEEVHSQQADVMESEEGHISIDDIAN